LKSIEKKQILITVKAYPNPSRDLGETVCCAGIDINNYQLTRLYPIPFRDLESNRQFKKYNIIEVDCFRSDDKRPESYSIVRSSIRIIDYLGPENGTWKKRYDIVSKVPIKSMCQVKKDSEASDLSLGIIKPENITFDFKKHKLPDLKEREKYYSQTSFLDKKKSVIEDIPFRFYYSFKCDRVNSCEGHQLMIVDWEIYQAYRKWRDIYPANVLPEKIKENWLNISDTSKKEVLFYVGNMRQFRGTFMVLGVFYRRNIK
jgi:hypothetical protein